MWLAERLALPEGTRALLFDMDGVLIDSLAQDDELVGTLLAPYLEPGRAVPREVVRRWFPLSLDDFWVNVVADVGLDLSADTVAELVRQHEHLRRTAVPVVHDGVIDILAAAQKAGLRVAVVSNNPRAEVERMLTAGGLLPAVDVVVGNDKPGIARKPAPDPYHLAAAEVGVTPAECVAVEDSVLGLTSAHAAGCWCVGVATGANTFDALAGCGHARRCYTSFSTSRVVVGQGSRTAASVRTPNAVASHLVGLMMSQLPSDVEVVWSSDGWWELGAAMGAELSRLVAERVEVVVVQDGRQVHVRSQPPWGATCTGTAPEVDSFLNTPVTALPGVVGVMGARCLVALLDGLAHQARLGLRLSVSAGENPTLAWPSMYRAVGSALADLVRQASTGEQKATGSVR